MQVVVLGAHHLESKDSRLSCLLVDGRLALDAGSLSSGLSLEEQGRLKAVLVTHRHFDHIRDLPTIGLATQEGTKEVWGLKSTLQFIRSHLSDGEIYPDMEKFPSPDAPSFHMKELVPLQTYEVAGHTVRPISVTHGTLDATGYEVSDGARTLFYTGDTGGGLSSCWEHTSPHLLAIEVSLPDAMQDRARRSGHLTPAMLEDELRQFKTVKGYFPEVLALHMSPVQEQEIRAGLSRVADSLGARITPGKRHLKMQV